MFDVFGEVKTLFKLESTATDNVVFRLHYKATFIVLVVCSVLVTSKQYIGDPIDCIVDEIPLEVSVLNPYTRHYKLRLVYFLTHFSLRVIYRSS